MIPARQIDIERARWAHLDTLLGLKGDPLRGFLPCEKCGQRGPLVPLWMRPPWSAADALKQIRAEQIRLASTWVCADGCPPEGGEDREEEA